jgi:hypothetical protein
VVDVRPVALHGWHEHPEQPGECCEREHGRDVHLQDPPDQVHDAGLEGSRVLDVADDLLQEGVLPDSPDFDEQCSGAVDRPADHLVADALAHRHRLAGDQRLVHG